MGNEHGKFDISYGIFFLDIIINLKFDKFAYNLIVHL